MRNVSPVQSKVCGLGSSVGDLDMMASKIRAITVGPRRGDLRQKHRDRAVIV